MFYWFLKRIGLGPLLYAIFRPWVRGLEHIPREGGAILASNHLSFSDSIFLPLVVRRRVTFLAKMDYFTGEVNVISETPYSDGVRASVKCYGADEVLEGVAIMIHEGVDVSITGNSTNPTRFQHLVAGTYKKWSVENSVNYFSVASGGGTGRTLHPDNVAAGPASYGLTDSMGRMHSDAQFAGSSSVPAHVEMMGLIGMGNNPMVGATVACAVEVEQSYK